MCICTGRLSFRFSDSSVESCSPYFHVVRLPPNTSVEPTAYAVSVRTVMDFLSALMPHHSSAHRLWLTSIC